MKPLPFDEVELQRRMSVWYVLADLFLDGEADEAEEPIARHLKHHGYSRAEAEAMLYKEVGPAFCGNLLSIAGRWGAWDYDEVKTRVLAHLNLPAPLRLLSNWSNAPIIAFFTRSHWRRICAEVYPAP